MAAATAAGGKCQAEAFLGGLIGAFATFIGGGVGVIVAGIPGGIIVGGIVAGIAAISDYAHYVHCMKDVYKMRDNAKKGWNGCMNKCKEQ